MYSYCSGVPLASLGAVKRAPGQAGDSLQQGDYPAGEHPASILQDFFFFLPDTAILLVFLMQVNKAAICLQEGNSCE